MPARALRGGPKPQRHACGEAVSPRRVDEPVRDAGSTTQTPAAGEGARQMARVPRYRLQLQSAPGRRGSSDRARLVCRPARERARRRVLEHHAHAVALAEQPLARRVAAGRAEAVVDPGVGRHDDAVARAPQPRAVVDVVVVVEHAVVERPDALERRASQRHAAAHRVERLRGDLGPLVGLVHRQVGRPSLAVDGPACAVDDERIVVEEHRGGDSADRLVRVKRIHEVSQPTWGREPIGVDESDDLAIGLTKAQVTGVRTASIARATHDGHRAAA